MRVILSRSARSDIDGAVRYYANRSRTSAVRFIDVIYHSLTLIRENPDLGMLTVDGHRRFPMRGFPYSICYYVNSEDDEIKIVAVPDQRRRPGYWRFRVDDGIGEYMAWAA